MRPFKPIKTIKNIAIGVLFLTVTTAFTDVSSIAACKKGLKIIAAYYKAHNTSNSLYMRYTSQISQNNEQGKLVLNEVWKKGEYQIYKNGYMTLYKDSEDQVTILDDTQTILIQKVVKNKVQEALPESEQIEIFLKVASAVKYLQAGKYATMHIELPSSIDKKPNYLKNIQLEYDPNTGKIIGNTYAYRAPYKNRVEVYKYQKITKQLNSKVDQPALSRVMINGKLKQAYQKYQVRDLRNKR